MSPTLSRLLQRAWDIDVKAKTVITDMQSVIIVHPPSTQGDSNELLYEYLATRDLSVIRILIAAYLYMGLPGIGYINLIPRPDILEIIIPSGAPIDPKTPLLSDEDVFRTHLRHTDFDYYTLTHDRERALQFFRWKEWVMEKCSPILASSGDIVTGITNGFTRHNVELRPFYPIDDFLLETTDHIESTRRPCSLEAAGMLEAFNSSESFELELMDDLTQDENSRLCRTFKCRIISVNNKDTRSVSPTLCVKFYDDRFHPMDPPDEDALKGGMHWWWIDYTDAEGRVKCEHMTYKRLDFMQGSLIPHYYGAHSVSTFNAYHHTIPLRLNSLLQFTFPGNHELYGVLMEYVPVPTLESGIAGTLPKDQQIELVCPPSMFSGVL